MAKSSKSKKQARSQFALAGTIQAKGGRKKPLPAGKVVKLRKLGNPVTIVRPAVHTQDGPAKMVFKADPKAGKIKVVLDGAGEKLVITRSDHESKPWRLTAPSRQSILSPEKEDFDPTFHKTAYDAYKAGVRDVWDLKL
jgi:hypothetical protein